MFFNRKPKKEPPIPKRQKGEPFLSFEEWDKLTDCLVEVKPTDSKPPCQYSNHTKYKLVTRDEFILEYARRFYMNKEQTMESWEKISQGYNFCFIGMAGEYYSVSYINKLLER
ncbi:hypothetical protein NL50_17340 [Clostridium acetobutylicum]|nr:hypothetical protein NL50_17340 [Clostridium acetobutylicum]